MNGENVESNITNASKHGQLENVLKRIMNEAEQNSIVW